MAKRRQSQNRTTFRALALVTQLGITMIVSIGLPCLLGVWLDRKWETSFWTLLLFFIGAVAGARNVYRMARRIYFDDSSRNGKEDGSNEDAGGVKEGK